MKKLNINDFEKSYTAEEINNMTISDYIKITYQIRTYFLCSLNKNEKKLFDKWNKICNYTSNLYLKKFSYSNGKMCNALIVGLLFSEKKIKLCSSVINIQNKLINRMPNNMKITYFNILFR